MTYVSKLDGAKEVSASSSWPVQTQGATPHAGAPVHAARAPVIAAQPSSTAATQAVYVRKTNLIALISVILAMVLASGGVLVALSAVRNALIKVNLLIASDSKVSETPLKVGLSFFWNPNTEEKDYMRTHDCNDLTIEINVFHAFCMVIHVSFAVLCMCVRLLTVKGGKRYNFMPLKWILGYTILCGHALYWSDFRISAGIVCLVLSLFVLPYFCIAASAMNDVTDKKARRWLPFYFEILDPAIKEVDSNGTKQ